MKQRVISGTVICLLTFACVYVGGYLFFGICSFIAIWGAYEFCNSRNRKINWFEYTLMLLYIISINYYPDKAVGITLASVVCFLALAVLDNRIVFQDSAISIVESIILAVAIYEMLQIENLNKWMFGYLVIICYLTDAFAYFTGMRFGKHKLNPIISPNKTIEGAVGGWIFGATLSFAYAACFNFFDIGFEILLLCSIILPVVSQIGDLTFSLIKRTYDIKDFSKLIPGHGGLLDRFDSISFVLVAIGVIFYFIR